jgi:Transposase DDE domain group 1
MTDATPLPFDLPAVERKKLTVDFEGGNQSSDAGLLLLRAAERKLGVCQRIADVMPDQRDQSRVRHEMFSLIASRAFAIACGYKDANDLNRLRHDPVMKLAVERLPESGKPLASQSTISRLENAPRKTEAARLTVALIEQFCTSVRPGKREINCQQAALMELCSGTSPSGSCPRRHRGRCAPSNPPKPDQPPTRCTTRPLHRSCPGLTTPLHLTVSHAKYVFLMHNCGFLQRNKPLRGHLC